MSLDDNDFLEEIKKDFLNEVTFDLDQAEESYLKLDKPELRDAELTKIFRLAHSLKGTGAAVGFLDLAGFAHVVEDFLALLRLKSSLVDHDAISILLKAGDAFRTRIEMLKQNDTSVWNIESLKTDIVNFIKVLENKINSNTELSTEELPSSEVKPFEENMNQQKSNDDEDFFKMKNTSQHPTQLEIPSQLPIQQTAQSIHLVEESLQEAPAVENTSQQSTASKNKNTESSMIKIESNRVDTVLNLVGELVVTKSQLMNHITADMENGKLSAIASLMDKIIRELQDKTLSMRMTPLKQLFFKTQRIVRDISLKINKEINFEMSGEETEIDRSLVEILADPLMHMIRNALDHGIERTEIRKANGKSEKGNIKLMAFHEGGRVLVRIEDDGGGIDRNKILAKALKSNLISANTDTSKLSDRQVFEFLCLPGFSTAEKVTDLSGRGVGLDVVKSNIEKIRGTLEIQSVLGKGTTFIISLPLTTSIIDGILLEINNSVYVLPIGVIKEILSLEPKNLIPLSQGDLILKHRDEVFPVIHLPCLLSNCEQAVTSDENMVLLIESGPNIIGIIVDKVIGQTQVVLKSLGETFHADHGVAGGAIMGDGRVALVLDPIGLRDYFEQKKHSINFINKAG